MESGIFHQRRRLLQSSLTLAGLGLLSGCAISLPGTSPPKKIPRLGFLSPNSPPAITSAKAFFDALESLGYVDGETILIEYRWAEGHEERLPELAAELVALNVDVIYGFNTVASQAARQATSTIPIVFAPANDPVGAGLVTNFARPNGNATGLKFGFPGLPGKRLELLNESVPGRSRVGVLGYAASLSSAGDWAEMQVAGQKLGLGLLRQDVQTVADFQLVIAAMAAAGAEALITLGDSFIARNAGLVVSLAAQHRLPAMYEQRTYPDLGGLMGYGPDILAGHRRAATYVDRILKGATPADLPVEQPTTVDFVINQKTAAALGLTIPAPILQLATEIIP